LYHVANTLDTHLKVGCPRCLCIFVETV